jgi:hypothetical protein
MCRGVGGVATYLFLIPHGLCCPFQMQMTFVLHRAAQHIHPHRNAYVRKFNFAVAEGSATAAADALVFKMKF